MSTHYVDSKELERVWSAWNEAIASPTLEPYRIDRVLWTEVEGRGASSPSQIKNHCIAVGTTLIKLQTRGGEIITETIQTDQGLPCNLPLELSLGDQVKYFGIGPKIHELHGYRLERPVATIWVELISQITLICTGVMRRLNVSQELREDAHSDVMLQVIRKLRGGKLRFEPGKAPVFNLLTTTIMNCAYSWLAKEGRNVSNKNKLVDGLSNGSIPPMYHSLAVSQ